MISFFQLITFIFFGCSKLLSYPLFHLPILFWSLYWIPNWKNHFYYFQKHLCFYWSISFQFSTIHFIGKGNIYSNRFPMFLWTDYSFWLVTHLSVYFEKLSNISYLFQNFNLFGCQFFCLRFDCKSSWMSCQILI